MTEPGADLSGVSAAEAAELFRQKPDRYLDVGEGAVAYRRIGSGPNVLFVHGWPVSGATFRTLLPHLADQVTCHLIDLPGAGASQFGPSTTLTVAQHIHTVRRVIDILGLEDLAVVGHDSGGLIARHALAGDSRLRAMGLINTEQPQGLSLRFRSFLAARHLPGLDTGLGWIAGSPTFRRNRFALGAAFADRSYLDGEFDEFFLRPLRQLPERRRAAVEVLRSFDVQHVRELADLHRRLDVPVRLVWGDRDPFFPIAWAKEMTSTFRHAELTIIKGAGLFCHEERPAEVARALLPTLLRYPSS